MDVEFHVLPGEQVHPSGGENTSAKTERTWDKDGRLRTHTFRVGRTEHRLQFMDTVGIDMAAITLAVNYHRNIGIDEVKRGNDFLARLVKENPKRFVALAVVLPLGGEPAMKELERAVKGLGMKGVHISTRVAEQHLDFRGLWPFYEKVQQLGVPINVHVHTEPPGFDALLAPYGLHYVIARELDMCAATFRVCLGGVLEDFPDLKFIINHFGGGISAVKERLDAYMSHVGSPAFPSFYQGKPLITRPWTEYFDKLYFNLAGREVGVAAVKCALTNINPGKLLFGTDYPFNFEDNPLSARRYITEIKKLDLPQADIDGILGGNAARLFNI